jgi:hypothetical protein
MLPAAAAAQFGYGYILRSFCAALHWYCVQQDDFALAALAAANAAVQP